MTNDPKLDLLIKMLDHAVTWKDEELMKAVARSILHHTAKTEAEKPRPRSFNPDDTTRAEED